MEKRLQEVKSIISSLIISSPYNLTISQLQRDYLEIQGVSLPFGQFGYRNAEQFLRTLTDVITVQGSGPTATVQAFVTERNQHINQLVLNQRKPKRRYRNRTGFRSHSDVKRFRPLMPERAPPPRLKSRTHSSYASSAPPQPSTSSLNTQFERLDLSGKKINFNGLYKDMNSLNLTNDETDKPSTTQSDIYQSDTEIDNVPIFVQTNLKELLDSKPEGMWCRELPKFYKERFGTSLVYESFGYISLIHMCKDLSHIFGYERQDRGDYRLFAKDKGSPSFPKNVTTPPEPPVTKESTPAAIESVLPSTEDVRTSVQDYAYPDDIIISPNDIPSQFVDSDQKELDFIDVIVTEVYDPSKFWLILARNQDSLDRLMDSIQEFYHDNHSRYEMMPFQIETNMLCCARYLSSEYHRGMIVDLMPEYENIVKIFFFDYGSVTTVKLNEICFLHKKFATLPKQAIKARLMNIYPPIERSQWSVTASIRFLEMTSNKQLVAHLQKIEWAKQILKINLADTTTEYDYYVNDALVEEGLAIFNFQDQKPRAPGGAMPVVKFLHLFPMFEEIEYGIVPNLNEMVTLRQRHISLAVAYPHYFDTDMPCTTKQQLNSEVENATSATSATSMETDHAIHKRIISKLRKANLSSSSGGYFDTSIDLTNPVPKANSSEIEMNSTLSPILSNSNNSSNRIDESPQPNKLDKMKEIIASFPLLSTKEDFPFPSGFKSHVTPKFDTVNDTKIIEMELLQKKLHVLKYKNKAYFFVIEVLSCFTEVNITIEEIRKELLLKCVVDVVLDIDMQHLSEELLRMNMIKEGDVKKRSMIHTIPVAFLPRLLHILQCTNTIPNFHLFLAQIHPTNDIWHKS